VEAAGVEPDISVENTKLTDSRNASFSWNTMIAKSSVQITYKDGPEFPELQTVLTATSWTQHSEVLLQYLYISPIGQSYAGVR
jgi:hypothetical protein